jgi:hypothetical protein
VTRSIAMKTPVPQNTTSGMLIYPVLKGLFVQGGRATYWC